MESGHTGSKRTAGSRPPPPEKELPIGTGQLDPVEYGETSQIILDCKRTAGSRPPLKGDKTPPKNPRLCIFAYLKAGFNPAKIGLKLNIPPSTIQYHLTILKKQGLINRVGYGTWEVLIPPDEGAKRTAGSRQVGQEHLQTTAGLAEVQHLKPDTVRAHAFMLTLQIPPGLRNWTNVKREKYMDRNSIKFTRLNICGSGQRIMMEGRKVWLTNHSIIIYDKASYFAEEALKAKNLALATHLSIIKRVERLLHTSFQIGSDYKFKVSRQHYALIHNALATQYNGAGEKLEIRTDKGVWFLIDNSFGMNEAETVHPDTAMSDAQKVQDYFNGLKKIPTIKGGTSYTPDFVLTMLTGIQQNQMAFATNHIEAIQSLSNGVQDMNGLLEQIGGKI